ncbi:MAG: universal stress protein [Acidimicrobiia bacterium]|nr:universal stress protein [Acidimicrobiia bacterium]
MNLILVPLDTSEAAAEAIEPAMELADALDYSVLLVAIADVVVKNAMHPVMESEHINAEQALTSYLGQLAADVGGRGVEVQTMVIDSMDPAASIADTAEAKGAEMIVMSSHGRTGAARWLLGSTAERVIRHAKMPVHLIPVR